MEFLGLFTFSIIPKHKLAEKSLKDEVKKLIDKKMPRMTVFLYLKYFLENLSSIEVIDVLNDLEIDEISDVFRDLLTLEMNMGNTSGC